MWPMDFYDLLLHQLSSNNPFRTLKNVNTNPLRGLAVVTEIILVAHVCVCVRAGGRTYLLLQTHLPFTNMSLFYKI